MKQVLVIMTILVFIAMPAVMAVDLNQQISTQDQATFDQILQPVMKIYNFVKYIASAIAALVLLLAGIMYMTSGADPKKRDNAKSMTTYVLIGLVLIWAAPLAVNFIVG